GSSRVARMRMVVVLPAPLGPTKPKICPVVKANEMSSTAFVRPKYFLRLWMLTRIAGDLLQGAKGLRRSRLCPARGLQDAKGLRGSRLRPARGQYVGGRSPLLRRIAGDLLQDAEDQRVARAQVSAPQT